MLRASTIRFDVAALPAAVTRLTLIVTFPAVVLVAVNLSMIVLQLVAVLRGLGIFCLLCWNQNFNCDGHWIPPILFDTVRMMDGMPGCGAAAAVAAT